MSFKSGNGGVQWWCAMVVWRMCTARALAGGGAVRGMRLDQQEGRGGADPIQFQPVCDESMVT